jgi:hypothetical protein
MSNGYRIDIPQDYFARIAAREYNDDAGMALIREFAQNSADAGATAVEFRFLSENWLQVTDDGKGADERKVRTKLLVPLASEKDGEAIGGFGKAKELLYFGNEEWRIRTRDIVVEGSYLTVKSFQTDGAHHVHGFIAEVKLPPGLYTAARSNARDFLRNSERPGVSWRLDGITMDQRIKRPARAAKDFGFAKGYVQRDVDDSTIYLRTGGLLTSTRYGYHGPTVGRVIIEVTGKSSELLTPARDWFRSSEHRRAVESWLNGLVTDARKTLADDVGDEVVFEDYEVVEDMPVAEAGTVKRDEVVPEHGGMKVDVSFRSEVPVEVLAEALAGVYDPDGILSGSYAGAKGEGATLTTPGASAPQGGAKAATTRPAKRKDGFDMALLPKLDGVKRVVVHTGGKEHAKTGTKWLRKNAEAARKMLAAWTTAVRAVAKANGLPIDAVGLTFAPDAEAEFVRAKNGRFGMLLNPLKLDLSDEFVADELLDRALHETAHLVTRGGHDEAFVQAEFTLRRKCRGSTVRGAVARSLRTVTVQAAEEVA